jgi:uracil-DNA glycosylase family 4
MLDARRRELLKTMGIDLWQQRDVEPVQGEPSPEWIDSPPEASSQAPISSAQPSVESSVSDSAPTLSDIEPAALGWNELGNMVSACTRCALHQGRTQAVFGVGDRHARLMVIGEAPGAEEDKKGEPFVGRAGQLLNAMLAAIGFAREQVYIANIVKCRPPSNRDPHADEAAACEGFLHRQVELVAPDLILSVGRVSAHNLLHTDAAVGRLRGREHRFQPGDIPLIVTYHPAYLLRRPEEKAKAWQDLQVAHRLLRSAP